MHLLFHKLDSPKGQKILKANSTAYQYLVRDINSPIYFRQSTNIFLTKFDVMIEYAIE